MKILVWFCITVVVLLIGGCELICEPVTSTTYQIKNTTGSDSTTQPLKLFAVKVHFYNDENEEIRTDSIGDLEPGQITEKIMVDDYDEFRLLPSFQFTEIHPKRYYTSRDFVLIKRKNRVIKLTLRGFVLK